MEYLLYGLRPGQEDYMEELLTVRATRKEVEAIKKIAKADGWERFRIATYNGEAPDFTKVIK
jgi:hypothetical protein